MSWDRAWVSVFYILAAALILYEIWVLLDNKPSTPPITMIMVRELPWWLTLPFLFWLFVHFTIAYAKNLGWTGKLWEVIKRVPL